MKKILLITSISILIISISLFSLFLIEDKKVDQQMLDSTNLIKEKKILILGSSLVSPLDYSYLENSLNKNSAVHYSVYNDWRSNNHPSYRIYVLPSILEYNPDIILYGIGYRALEYELGKAQCFSQGVIKTAEILKTDFEKLFLRSDQELNYYEKHNRLTERPLERDYTVDAVIPNNEIIFNHIKNPNFIICEDNRDIEIASLEFILDKINDNNENVQIILFNPPKPHITLNQIPDSAKESFNTIMKDLAINNNATYYDLSQKFQYDDIFSDWLHSARGPASGPYNDEILRILNQK
jgi:hypothetical protein